MVYKLFLIIFMFSISMFAMLFSNATIEETTEIKKESIITPERHMSDEAGYSIQFPVDWEVMKKVMGTDVIALAPTTGPEDLFRENANVIFAQLEGPIKAEEYFDLNLKSLQQLLTDFDLEEDTIVKMDGVDAKRIIFTHTMGVVHAKVLQYLILNGNKAYVLTFTADPIDFDKFLPKFEEIATSFAFEDTAMAPAK